MKKRAMVVAMLTVMGLVALSAGIAQAGWTACTISEVGAVGYGYVIKITAVIVPPATTPVFTNLICLIDTSGGKQKEMYAAALTAFANSSNVLIYVDPPYTDYTTAWGVYAIK